MPIYTYLANAISLRPGNLAGVTGIKLPQGTALTHVEPDAGSLKLDDRLWLDSSPKLHVVVLEAEAYRCGPQRFDGDLLKWAIARADTTIVCGSLASPEAVKLVEGWLASARRAVLVLTGATRQREWEWLQAASRMMQRSRLRSILCSPILSQGERGRLLGLGGWPMDALSHNVPPGAAPIQLARQPDRTVLGFSAGKRNGLALWSSYNRISTRSLPDARVDGEPSAIRVAELIREAVADLDEQPSLLVIEVPSHAVPRKWRSTLKAGRIGAQIAAGLLKVPCKIVARSQIAEAMALRDRGGKSINMALRRAGFGSDLGDHAGLALGAAWFGGLANAATRATANFVRNKSSGARKPSAGFERQGTGHHFRSTKEEQSGPATTRISSKREGRS